MKTLENICIFFGIDLKQLLCKHTYTEEDRKLWGYWSCGKCWHIPNKKQLRRELLAKPN